MDNSQLNAQGQLLLRHYGNMPKPGGNRGQASFVKDVTYSSHLRCKIQAVLRASIFIIFKGKDKQ